MRPERLLQVQSRLQRQARQRLPVQAQGLVSALAQRGPPERQLLVLVAARERRRVLRQPELPGARWLPQGELPRRAAWRQLGQLPGGLQSLAEPQ